MSRYVWLVASLLVVLLVTGACQESNEFEEEQSEAPIGAGQTSLNDEDADVQPQDETELDEDEPAEEDVPDSAEVLDNPTLDEPDEEAAVGTPSMMRAEEEEVRFALTDGTVIVASYYPPVGDGPLPGVILMHQMGADKRAWAPLIEQFLTQRPDLALFAFDFPGHGESEGDYSDEAALEAARAALQEFRGYEVVADDEIVMIGASIGADAAVDACGEGCAGAVSVSPGGWLGIPYQEALAELQAKDVSVLCIAAENDGDTAETCEVGQEVGLSDYQVLVYEGGLHGNALVAAKDVTPAPAPVELIVQWLSERWSE